MQVQMPKDEERQRIQISEKWKKANAKKQSYY